MKKKVKQYALIILISSGLSVMGFVFLHGIPLRGIPKAENISYVEVFHNGLGVSSGKFTEKEDIEKAVNIVSLLNYEIGTPKHEDPLITITYHMKDDDTTSVLANKETVYCNGKAYKIKGDGGTTFVKITEGLFFYDVLLEK